ncbi:hypothetical protein MP638_005393 [Amoeboaphelidium occidentale]|nr:hypothetical protein MP638_005393 [Amoeboaphelidium occidentale]
MNKLIQLNKKINSTIYVASSAAKELDKHKFHIKVPALLSPPSKAAEQNLLQKIIINPLTNLFNSPEQRCKQILKELESLLDEYLTEYRVLYKDLASGSGFRPFTGPELALQRFSTVHSTTGEPINFPNTRASVGAVGQPSTQDQKRLKYRIQLEQQVFMIYQLLVLLCFEYRMHCEFLMTDLQLKLIPQFADLIFSQRLIVTSPALDYLPSLDLLEIRVTEEVVNEFIVKRHPKDSRYDVRTLHKDGNVLSELNRIFRQFVNLSSNDTNYGTIVIDDYNGLYSGCLTATYPLLIKNKLNGEVKVINDTEPVPEKLEEFEEFELLNDPNNDGYLCIIGNGFVIGGTVDGSGAGLHARLAANIILSVLYEMATQSPSQEVADHELSGKYTPFYLSNRPWRSSHDAMMFLKKVCKFSQELISDCDEAGASTVALYAITTLDQSFRTSFDKLRESSHFNDRFPPGSDIFVCNYLIAGDAEGFHYSPRTEQWQSMVHPPSASDSIRLNSSYTPGGIGRSHGDTKRIWGACLWPEYVKQRKEYMAKKAVEAKSEDFEPTRDEFSEFYSHMNNIHFGQLLMNANDFVIFTTDGLGDTLDPVQVFPRPKLIHGLEDYSNWQDFAKNKSAQPAVVARKLKEQALDKALSSTMTPYLAEELSDDESLPRSPNPLAPVVSHSIQDGGWPSKQIPTAKEILEACLTHARTTTHLGRLLYADKNYFAASRFDKQRTLELKIEKWIANEMSKRFGPRTLPPGYQFVLPAQNVPYAKTDHLAIQVLQAKVARNRK